MAMQAEWHRQQGDRVFWDENVTNVRVITGPENIPFLELPAPDRVFTRAKEYTSGNYKHLPGTHILSANGCWWHKCKFCIEKGCKQERRKVDDVIEEIKKCKRLGFREVFDDSGTFPIGRWLDDFCLRIKDVGISVSANMRCVDLDYSNLRRAGFRMLLFGVESANQQTLDNVSKGTKADAIKYVIKAHLSGIECHIAVMFGYPWETEKEADNTLRMVHEMLRKGYAQTAQASFYTVPGVKSNEEHRRYVKEIYKAGFHLDFWGNRIKNIRNMDDLRYLWRGVKAWYTQR